MENSRQLVLVPVSGIDEKDRVRFWSKVLIRGERECWPRAGFKDRKGYGRFGIGRGRCYLAHRMAWILTNGPIPEGQCVCHNCPGGDNPACVNPKHLFLGTKGDNNRDRAQKGRSAIGERNGRYTHPERTQRGERHAHAKLDDSAVVKIRRRSQQGEFTAKIARDFGVDHKTIRKILQGRAWKHVPPELNR